MTEDEGIHSHDESISAEISERVRSVISAAEAAAAAIRLEADQEAQLRRRAAEAEVSRYLEEAKREADELLHARMRRISEISDAVIQGSESILMRMEDAQEVKRRLETLVRSLAETAETLADERSRDLAELEPAGSGEPPAAAAAPAPEQQPAAEPGAFVESSSPEVETAEPSSPKVETAERDAESSAAAGPDPGAGPSPTETAVAAAPEPPAPVATAEPPGPAAAAMAEQASPEPTATDEEPTATDEPGRAGSPVEKLRAATHAGKPGTGVGEEEPRGFAAIEGDELLSARLVALQMAVAGSSRVEVEGHLRKVFDLPDPDGVLNDVFGQDAKT